MTSDPLKDLSYNAKDREEKDSREKRMAKKIVSSFPPRAKGETVYGKWETLGYKRL